MDDFGAIVMAEQGGNLPGVRPFNNLNIRRAVVSDTTAEVRTLRVIDIDDVALAETAGNPLDASRQQAALLPL